LFATSAILMLLSLALVLPGVFVEPALLYRIRPAGMSALLTLTVFDLVHLAVLLGVFGLGLAVFAAAERAKGTAKPKPAVIPPVRPRLRLIGRGILLLGIAIVVGGFQAGVFYVDDTGLWLVGLGAVPVGLAVCWFGGRTMSAAKRAAPLRLPALAKRASPHGTRGWALRTLSWVMRVGGSVALLAGILGVTAFAHKGLLSFVLWLVVFVVGIAVLKLSTIPAMLANRYLATVLTSAADLPPGSYVLYLRPFAQDVGAAARVPWNQKENPYTNPFTSMMQSSRAHEERLRELFAEFGPLLAVGSPGEEVPGGAGAFRIYLPLVGWQDTVAELIDNARLIVLGTGPGPGTVWEYVEVLRRRPPSRLVLLVTDPIEYKRFKASTIVETEGVLLELKNRYGAQWEAPLLPDLPDYTTSQADRSCWFRAMVYFARDWEPHMVSVSTSMISGNFRVDNDRMVARLYPMIEYLRRASGQYAGEHGTDADPRE